MSPTRFQLPDIITYLSLEFAINPFLDAASADSDAWLRSYGYPKSDLLAKRLRDTDPSYCAAVWFPCAGADRFRAICDLMQVTFAFDDELDYGSLSEDKAMIVAYCQALTNALRDPDNVDQRFPIAVAWADLWKRLLETSPSPGSQKRFIEGLELMIKSALKQDVSRASQKTDPGIDEHIVIRRNTSGSSWMAALAEIAWGLDLPDHVINHPAVQRVKVHMTDIVSWCNELYSYNVEQAMGQTTNLVPIAMKELGLDLQGAVDYVGDRTKRAIDEYVDLKSAVPVWGPEIDAQVEKYLTGFDHLITGNAHWSLHAGRYFGADVEEVRRTLWVTLLPREDARV